MVNTDGNKFSSGFCLLLKLFNSFDESNETNFKLFNYLFMRKPLEKNLQS